MWKYCQKEESCCQSRPTFWFLFTVLLSKNVLPVVPFSVTHGLNLRSPLLSLQCGKPSVGLLQFCSAPTPPVSDGGEGGRNRAPFDLMDGRKRPLPPSPPVLHPNPLWTRETVSTLLPFVTKDSIAKHKTIDDRFRREHCFDILSIGPLRARCQKQGNFQLPCFLPILRAASRIYSLSFSPSRSVLGNKFNSPPPPPFH